MVGVDEINRCRWVEDEIEIGHSLGGGGSILFMW